MPYGLLYTGINVPRAYRSATPAEVSTKKDDKVAEGKACNSGVLSLVAWGEGGYDEAVEDALKGTEPSSILYDIKSDSEVFSILGFVYLKNCTKVTGKIGRLAQK